MPGPTHAILALVLFPVLSKLMVVQIKYSPHYVLHGMEKKISTGTRKLMNP
jgi:hypothetical protein